jgi:hypothetical protein
VGGLAEELAGFRVEDALVGGRTRVVSVVRQWAAASS